MWVNRVHTRVSEEGAQTVLFNNSFIVIYNIVNYGSSRHKMFHVSTLHPSLCLYNTSSLGRPFLSCPDNSEVTTNPYYYPFIFCSSEKIQNLT